MLSGYRPEDKVAEQWSFGTTRPEGQTCTVCAKSSGENETLKNECRREEREKTASVTAAADGKDKQKKKKAL
jgi:hypothetical protein